MLLVGACGGASGEPAATTSADERGFVEVVLDDHLFSPAVLTPRDERVVRARNLGDVEHSWTVLAEPVETELELASATILAEARVEVGQSATVDLGSLAPGRYQVVCVIPGHLGAGMVGELVVDG